MYFLSSVLHIHSLRRELYEQVSSPGPSVRSNHRYPSCVSERYLTPPLFQQAVYIDGDAARNENTGIGI